MCRFGAFVRQKLDAGRQQRCQGLDPLRISISEAGRSGAVEVDYRDHCSAAQHRNHKFAAAGRITGNVAGEGMHICNKLRRATFRGRPAYAFAKRNANAGGAAHEWPEHQFMHLAVLGGRDAVKARPVQIGQEFPQERGDIRHIRDRIGLISGESIGGRAQIAVDCVRIGSGSGFEIIHELRL